MKATIRTIFFLLLTCVVCATYAQSSSTLSVTNIIGTGNTWSYGTVDCVSTNNVTSITLSMINNDVASNNSGIMPSGTYNSLGNNPRTTTYVFAVPISADKVENFLKGISFRKTTEVAGANNSVRISVDANPTLLPLNATITVWDKHPDGALHYYVWVSKPQVFWSSAYQEAKSFYFQGMRGYLATITSIEENSLLTNISAREGWSAGARTSKAIDDALTFGAPPMGPNYRWTCGPEAGFTYYNGAIHSDPNSGVANNAFSRWNTVEPNNSGSLENCMQVNHSSNLDWNDYANTQPAIQGFFIEFGGSGEAYNVGAANYPANAAYRRPSVPTNNAQWYLYSPGNTSSAVTTIKKAALRAHVMVLE